MKNYIVTYHATADLMAQSQKTTPEERAESMKAWRAWGEKAGENLVSFGQPLMGGLKVNQDGSTTPSAREVVGYSILQANSMDEAVTILQGHPHLKWDDACDIEVHESMPMPDGKE